MQITNKFQISNFKFQVSSSRGIALVAVLAILTVLAILAASFTVFSKMESDIATNIIRGMEANSIAKSGVEHVKTLLWYDSLNYKNPGDSYKDIWSETFTGKLQKKKPEVDVDLISNNGLKKRGKDGIWIPVHNKNNELIGRYAVAIEDECSKINLNVASMVPPLKPNEGLSTRELILSDGKSSGVPISQKAAIKILKEKYGPNRVPGAAGDDNENNNVCMGDGLDNDSDGLIDELDEGINELEEYVPHHPFGDDKSFQFMSEIGKIISPEGKISTKQLATLRHYASLNSKDESLRWDKPTLSWKKKSSLNVGDTREMFKQLKTANEKYLFEQDSKKLRALAANLVDYRDENHVLSTMSSEYGVEAICFNEILANEGSKNISVSHIDPKYLLDKEDRVHCLAFNYSFRDYRWSQPSGMSDNDGVNSTNIAEREVYNKYWGFAPYYKPGPNEMKYYPGKKRLKMQIAAQPRKKPGGFRCDEKSKYNTEGVFTDFKDLLRKRGKGGVKGNGDYARIEWPDDIWKGSYLVAMEIPAKDQVNNENKNSGWENKPVNTKSKKKAFYISENDEEWLYLEDVTQADYQKFLDGIYSTVQLRSWTYDKSFYAEFPEMSTWFIFQKLRPNTYYKTYIIESSLDLPNLYPNQGPTKGHKKMAVDLDVDGNVRSYNSQKIKNMKYRYKDGKAMQTDKLGCIDIYLTSSKDCNPDARNRVSTVSFMRPDIIELINISSRPISLRGWSLVANTGTLAYDIGKINSAIYYERKGRGKFNDKAPVIKPNEYFYICNNKEIFDLEYGSPKNGSYGATASEQMPLHEMDDESAWGIKFLIKKVQYIPSGGVGGVNKTIITCGNENWEPDLFRGETAEFQIRKKTKEPKNGDNATPNGIRKTITSNTKDSLIFDTINLSSDRGSGDEPGDYVMIVGLPRVGGFVSLTLKNEYDQVAGRLIQYGDPKKDVKRDWEKYINWSAEKFDPTHFTWIENNEPTFGGTVLKARNKCLPKGKNVAMAHIKNGSFASVGEIKNVRKKENWENIGDAKNKGDTIKTIQAVADFFTSSGMRLDAEDEDAHLSGWKPAFGKSAFADTKGLTDISATWKKDMWKDQTLSILSGKNRGESFSIVGNNKNRLKIAGLSVPGRKRFYVGGDNEYSVGPGFSSPLYYCYENAEPAEWEWKNKRIPKGNYKLYIAGLNDGIRTSEFLEENHNSRLNIYLFNYKKKKYDLIAERKKYGKNDMLFAGNVLPEHISDTGGIKLKIVPSDLRGKYSSGFAWFDYAYLTPLPVYGRININTASKRVLMALNKIDKTLANNIFLGKNSSGKNVLKPYNSISDILYVKGITPDIFAGIANLITARSDQFNVYVLAERIKDVNQDGKFEEGIDEILATSKLRTLIDRSGLTLKKTVKNGKIKVIQTESF